MLESDDDDAAQLLWTRVSAVATCLVVYGAATYALFRNVCFPLVNLPSPPPMAAAIGPCLTGGAITGLTLLLVGSTMSWRLRDGRAVAHPLVFVAVSAILFIPALGLFVFNLIFAPHPPVESLWTRANVPGNSPLLVYGAVLIESIVAYATIKAAPWRSFVISFLASWGATVAFLWLALPSAET